MRRKRLFLIIGGIIILLSIGLLAVVIRNQTELRSRAAGEAVTFIFTPASQSASINNNFVIDVALNAQTNNITGVDVRLTYNTTTADGVSFQPAGNFNTELIKTITDSTGTVRFAAVNTSSTPITGTVPIGTLTLKGTAVGSGNLSLQSAQVTAETISTALPLGTTTPASYTVTSAVPSTTPTLTFTPTPPAQTPTPTRTPTPPVPTTTTQPTPTRTPTPTPTSAPTNTPQPTNTPVPSTLTLALNLLLHAIGNGGDNQTPGAPGNFSPLNPTRSVTVTILNENDSPLFSVPGTVSFNNANGNFIGNVSLSQPLSPGNYKVNVVSPRYLTSQMPGFITMTTQNQNITIPINQTTLVVGDSNGDNSLNILDYNILSDCYSDLTPPKACNDPVKKLSADYNDDGNVNQFDFNLLIRNLLNLPGD